MISINEETSVRFLTQSTEKKKGKNISKTISIHGFSTDNLSCTFEKLIYKLMMLMKTKLQTLFVLIVLFLE